jgi:hypothetical protein
LITGNLKAEINRLAWHKCVISRNKRAVFRRLDTGIYNPERRLGSKTTKRE